MFTHFNINCPRNLLCARLIRTNAHDQRSSFPWLADCSCGFWFQESHLLLFSVPFLSYQCFVVSVGNKNCTAYSRYGLTRDLFCGFSWDHLFILVIEIAGNEPSTLLQLFCLFLPLVHMLFNWSSCFRNLTFNVGIKFIGLMPCGTTDVTDDYIVDIGLVDPQALAKSS